MKTTLDRDVPGGWEAGAAEYSLGLMPKDEIAGFEAHLVAEPDLQQDVAAWAEYFACFTDLIPEETPPPQVLRRIEGKVFGAVEKAPVWQQVLPYLIGAVVGVALAWIVFASGLLEPDRPVLSGTLIGADGALTLEARFDASTGVLTVVRTSDGVADGRVLELWHLRDDGEPVSLALLRGQETLVALSPDLARDFSGAVLLVSEEPAGGAPQGQPSSGLRAEGRLTTP
ncbi:anti-sigma-K factor rskA [Antarctobacter heliothermus]|uniref:Anti-sigma-K factor rskA n=1 Tax=Antarctobacter heliothermus TaxID=74033 RepID=A0A222E9U5_9RHOB|nr:anti-sigma factor [Antarctobacter heliothermus]ASP22850.1 anti-sigma-K factor rskA [Antarctobacter heliothermus]